MKRLPWIVLGLVVLLWVVSHRVNAQGSRITFDTGQVSVASTATSISAANASRTSILITNVGSTAIYVGNSAVTTSTGAYLPGGASVSIPTKDAVYGISSGSSETVSYLESYTSY